MPDIKTQAVAEKSVKTIDKSAIAAQYMKHAYVQAREKAERRTPSGEESPESYAVNRVSDTESVTACEGAHQGHRGTDATKENLAKLKARFQCERLIDPLKKNARKELAHSPVDVDGNIQRRSSVQRTANPIRRPAGAPKKASPVPHGEQGAVKTVQRTGKAVKQSARTTGQNRAVDKVSPGPPEI